MQLVTFRTKEWMEELRLHQSRKQSKNREQAESLKWLGLGEKEGESI
jgi:hypothetical protein